MRQPTTSTTRCHSKGWCPPPAAYAHGSADRRADDRCRNDRRASRSSALAHQSSTRSRASDPSGASPVKHRIRTRRRAAPAEPSRIQRFAKSDEIFEALAQRQLRRVDAAQPFARGGEVFGCSGLAKALEIRTRGDQVGAVGQFGQPHALLRRRQWPARTAAGCTAYGARASGSFTSAGAAPTVPADHQAHREEQTAAFMLKPIVTQEMKTLTY